MNEWFVLETVEDGMSVALLLTIYIAGLSLGGGYDQARDPRNSGIGLAISVASAGLAAVAVAVFWPSFSFSPGTIAVHLPVSVIGVFGLRRWIETQKNENENSHPRAELCDGVPDSSVQLDDIVSRPSVEIDRTAVGEVLSDRTVLVTGAGGSIGAHLTSQLHSLSPRRLVLVDINEHNLFRLERDLQVSDHSRHQFHLADVRSEQEMRSIFSETQPDIVFHTAAYKHVPLLERQPATAFRNNTLATVKLHELAAEHGVETFVFISTDKAVHPTSVLGATKQWADWYLRASSSPVDTRTVRFGNVFGSAGSVIPEFRKKLAAGDPLPVTHPHMERYFMSADEACRLLLHTLLLEQYPTYLLRMGEPIRIQWLAEKLIERWYPRIDPSTMIEHVGRRPGEKLSEQLVRENESVRPTGHPRIRGLESPLPYDDEALRRHLAEVRSLCETERADNERLRRLLLREDPEPSPSMA